MTKYRFLMALLLFLAGPLPLRAEAPASQPSANPAFELEQLAKSHHVPWPYDIVVYFYKNENGKWVTHESSFKKLPPELQNKDWYCWIDFSEIGHCKSPY